MPYFLECDACNKNITSANHYCYDCRAIFCDSCVIKEKVEVTVCSDCGWNLFGTDPKTGALFCRHCKDSGKDGEGHQLISVHKDKQVCPKCHSGNTIEIDDLKADLKEKYKNIVLDSRNVIKDFNNFINFLSLVKQKLLKVRLEHPVMVHEPALERDILSVMEESTLIERRIMNRVHSFFLLLQSKRDYFLGTMPWCNDDFPVLETYITQLQSDFVNFMAQIAESFNQPLDILQTTKERVEYIGNVRDFFIGFMNKGTINLEKGEYPVIHEENAKLDSDDDQSGHGHILITNKAFKFIKSTGYIRKTDALLFSFPLDKLLSSVIGGRVFKTLNFQFQGISLKFHVDKQRMQALINYIGQATTFNDSSLNADAIRKIRDFDVNSIFKIKSIIEDNINKLLSQAAGTAFQALSQAAAQDQGFQRDGALFGHQVPSSFNPEETVFDGGLDVDVDGMDAFFPPANQAGLGLGSTAGTPQAANARPPSPAISTGDFRNFTHASQQEDPWFLPAVPQAPAHQQDFQGQRAMQFQQHAQVQPQSRFQPAPQFRQAAPTMDQPAWNRIGSGVLQQEQSRAAQGTVAMHPQVQAMLQAHELDQRIQRSNQTKYLVAIMRNCEQKQNVIRETMRNLDYKFELGKIAPNVYFQTHTLFSERLVALDQQIQDIKMQLQQTEAALMRATHY